MIDIHIDAQSNQKLYFASDFHLGAQNTSRKREAKVVRWLETIRKDAAAIFLLGDVFDFWYEYKKVIPKGFARFQGKVAEITDSGIPVIIFSGNHDMWMKDYLSEEIGVSIYHEPAKLYAGNTKLLIGHGDGLGPGDLKYKMLKKLFKNKVARWCFSRVHPNLAFQLAHSWSRSSRVSSSAYEEQSFEEKEYLYQYCLQVEENEHFDYYIFGHRHIHLDMKVGANSRYLNLGEWVHNSRYAEFSNGHLELIDFED